jgi:ribosome-associated protein YbcJ (S4-like RNA binding protein)
VFAQNVDLFLIISFSTPFLEIRQVFQVVGTTATGGQKKY